VTHGGNKEFFTTYIQLTGSGSGQSSNRFTCTFEPSVTSATTTIVVVIIIVVSIVPVVVVVVVIIVDIGVGKILMEFGYILNPLEINVEDYSAKKIEMKFYKN